MPTDSAPRQVRVEKRRLDSTPDITTVWDVVRQARREIPTTDLPEGSDMDRVVNVDGQDMLFEKRSQPVLSALRASEEALDYGGDADRTCRVHVSLATLQSHSGEGQCCEVSLEMGGSGAAYLTPIDPDNARWYEEDVLDRGLKCSSKPFSQGILKRTGAGAFAVEEVVEMRWGWVMGTPKTDGGFEFEDRIDEEKFQCWCDWALGASPEDRKEYSMCELYDGTRYRRSIAGIEDAVERAQTFYRYAMSGCGLRVDSTRLDAERGRQILLTLSSTSTRKDFRIARALSQDETFCESLGPFKVRTDDGPQSMWVSKMNGMPYNLNAKVTEVGQPTISTCPEGLYHSICDFLWLEVGGRERFLMPIGTIGAWVGDEGSRYYWVLAKDLQEKKFCMVKGRDRKLGKAYSPEYILEEMKEESPVEKTRKKQAKVLKGLVQEGENLVYFDGLVFSPGEDVPGATVGGKVKGEIRTIRGS